MEGVLGFTTLFAGNFAPKGWNFCQGQLISIASNTALFSLLGTTYGGDGRVNFALPNLMGRAVVGAGQGPGLSDYSLGDVGGAENTILSGSQMALHGHGVSVTITPKAAANVTTPGPVGGVYGTGTENLFNPTADGAMLPYKAVLTTGLTGSGIPFSSLHPVLGLNYIICVQGVFPSRN